MERLEIIAIHTGICALSLLKVECTTLDIEYRSVVTAEKGILQSIMACPFVNSVSHEMTFLLLAK